MIVWYAWGEQLDDGVVRGGEQLDDGVVRGASS